MGSRADKAWRAAAECARLAQDPERGQERGFYLQARNAWIAVANRCEFIESLERGSRPSPANRAAGRLPAVHVPPSS